MVPKIEEEHALKWLGVTVSGIAAATIFVVLAWAVNKGFELSDESYYCLATANPNSNALLNSYFGLITHRLCPGVYDLRGLRICHLVYQLAAVLFFAISFLKFFSRWYSFSLSARVLIVLTLLIGSGLNYDYLPLAMSYNSWSLILSLVFFACSFQAGVSTPGVKLAFYALMGFCAILLFYNKLPNGLVVVGIYTFQLVLFERGKLWSWLFACTVGAVAGAFLLFGSPALIVTKTQSLIQNLTAISGSAMGVYTEHLRDFLLSYPGWKLLAAQAVAIAGVRILRRLQAPSWTTHILIVLNLLLMFFYVKGNAHHLGNDFTVIIIATCSALALGGKHFVIPREPLYIAIVLFALPFLLAVGTSNYIFYTASQLGVFSAGALLILIVSSAEVIRETLMPLVCAGFSAAVACTVVSGAVIHPYRQEKLPEKKLPLIFSVNDERVLESHQRFVMLCTLSEKLKTWNHEGREVLASPPVMGAIVLTGMRPAEVYWMGDDARAVPVNGYYFSKWKPAELPFLILSEDITKSSLQKDQLAKAGIELEKDYKLCDSVYMELNQRQFYFLKPLFR